MANVDLATEMTRLNTDRPGTLPDLLPLNQITVPKALDKIVWDNTWTVIDIILMSLLAFIILTFMLYFGKTYGIPWVQNHRSKPKPMEPTTKVESKEVTGSVTLYPALAQESYTLETRA